MGPPKFKMGHVT